MLEWYKEARFYNYSSGKSTTPGKSVTNFTQLVWKETAEVAFGLSASTTRDQSGHFWLIAVAFYSPLPNTNDFGINVLAPS